jgi:hypothetical protein
MRRWSATPFWAGLALILLGAGNWWVGAQKVHEHVLLVEQADSPAGVVPHEDFPNLSARTNSTLLQPFRVPLGRAAATQQKLEFYRIVEIGGRVLTLAGAFLVGVAFLVGRRRISLESH